MDNRKRYWDIFSSTYSDVWEKDYGRKILNNKELSFIEKYIAIKKKKLNKMDYLDIGCGTGRIIDYILKKDSMLQSIVGVDLSSEMLSKSKERFKHNKKVSFELFDIERQKLDKIGKFDFCTAIRILKYCKDIKKTIKNISSGINDDGIIIFTITNVYSVAFFDFIKIGHYKQSNNYIKKILYENGFRILEVEGFQKLPDPVYSIFGKSKIIGKVFKLEDLLKKIFGKTTFSRVLYYAAVKVDQKSL